MKFQTALIALIAAQTLVSQPAPASHPSRAHLISSGDALLNGGDVDGAIAAYSKAIKMNKKSFDGYFKRGQAEISASQFKKAAEDLTRAIKYESRFPDSYFLRAKAYDMLKKYKEELADLNVIIPQENDNAGLYLQRAKVELHLKYWSKVLDDCQRALRLGLPRDQMATLYATNAEAYKKLGKKREALREMAKYESLMP